MEDRKANCQLPIANYQLPIANCGGNWSVVLLLPWRFYLFFFGDLLVKQHAAVLVDD